MLNILKKTNRFWTIKKDKIVFLFFNSQKITHLKQTNKHYKFNYMSLFLLLCLCWLMIGVHHVFTYKAQPFLKYAL